MEAIIHFLVLSGFCKEQDESGPSCSGKGNRLFPIDLVEGSNIRDLLVVGYEFEFQ